MISLQVTSSYQKMINSSDKGHKKKIFAEKCWAKLCIDWKCCDSRWAEDCYDCEVIIDEVKNETKMKICKYKWRIKSVIEKI